MNSKAKKTINLHLAILLSVLLVHTILTVLFFTFRVTQFAFINLATIVLYIVLIMLTRKGHYMLCISIAFAEVVLNASYATLILPTECDFHLYVLGIVPVCCYDIYALSNIKHKMRLYVGIVAVSFFLIATSYLVSDLGIVVKTPVTINGIATMSAINYTLVCILMAMLSAMFITKISTQMDTYEEEIEKYEDLAFRDSLTGLFTRRYMEDSILEAIDNYAKKEEPFTLVMMDIDHFKEFNDRYGHDCGDKILTGIAELLVDCMKGFGEVSRWGGEEILLLVHGNDFQAGFMAEAIRRKIEMMVVEDGGQKVSVTATFGIATYRPDMTIQEVIDEADEKMYRGKNNGRNQVVK